MLKIFSFESEVIDQETLFESFCAPQKLYYFKFTKRNELNRVIFPTGVVKYRYVGLKMYFMANEERLLNKLLILEIYITVLLTKFMKYLLNAKKSFIIHLKA